MADALRVNNIHFGNVASNHNQAHIGFTSVGIGSTGNYGALQFVGVPNTLCWTANGTVGIGTTNPGYTIDVNGSSSAVGLSILRSTAISGSGRISYYNNTGSVQYWLLGSISSLVGNYGGSIDINGDLVRVDTALKNVQFGCSVNYNNFTVNRSSASGTTGTANGNIVVYRNTTTSLYDVYLVFGSYSSFVGDVIYSGATINLTPNIVAAPSASGTYILTWDHSVNTYTAITNSGNVGIGTTNPSFTLDVVGNIRATGSITSASTNIIPTGIIVMWSGSVSNVPAGWVLCNGTNGAPNLMDRFIVGAGSTYVTGGAGNGMGGSNTVTLAVGNLPSHTHTVPDHTHTTPNHSHTIYDPGHVHSNGFSYSSAVAASGGSYGVGNLINTGSSTTNISINSGGGGTSGGSGTLTSGGGSGTGAAITIIPLYYALCYIMKT